MPTSKQQAKVNKLQSRDAFGNTWMAPLMETCPKHPGFFCFAICCASCASYTNRKKALDDDMSRYICCNGDWPCAGKMKERDCPECCLCMEVFCCFSQSVFSTRWLLQDRLRIQNTKCDNCIIQCMIALQALSCICSIVACLTDNAAIDDAAECIDCVADVARVSVCACMQTQARYEMNENAAFKRTSAGPMRTQPPPQQAMHHPGGGHAPPHNQPPPPQAMHHPGGGHAPPPGYPAHGGGNPPPPGYPGGGQGPPPGYPSV